MWMTSYLCFALLNAIQVICNSLLFSFLYNVIASKLLDQGINPNRKRVLVFSLVVIFWMWYSYKLKQFLTANLHLGLRDYFFLTASLQTRSKELLRHFFTNKACDICPIWSILHHVMQYKFRWRKLTGLVKTSWDLSSFV